MVQKPIGILVRKKTRQNMDNGVKIRCSLGEMRGYISLRRKVRVHDQRSYDELSEARSH